MKTERYNRETRRYTMPLPEWIEKLGIKGKYDQQAQDFAAETDTEYSARFIELGKHFHSDKDDRAIWEIRLRRKDREYIFRYGASLVDTCELITPKGENEARYIMREWEQGREVFKKRAFEKKMEPLKEWTTGANIYTPRLYSILSCLQTYEPPQTLDDFMAEYGYEIKSEQDSRNIEKTFRAIQDEYNNMKMLYSNTELQALQAIA